MATMRLGGKGWAGVGVGAALAVIIGVSAATAGQSAPTETAETDGSAMVVTADPAPSATPTPTPVPTPVVDTRTETATEPVPFAQATVEDANRDAGTSAVTTAGIPGVRTKTYRVTLTDGVETGRELVSDAVTTPPVDQVTSVGTRQQAAAAPPPEAPACDPNYTGACVPIASDVDCAGGSGNGPAYVAGPVQVVGQDVYDLDRDGDGVGCE